MLLQIPELLSPEQVKEFNKILAEASWAEETNSAINQSVLSRGNLQLEQESKEAKILGDQIIMSLEQDPLFTSASLPLKVFPPIFNKNSNQQEVGSHIDDAIYQVPNTPFRIRADLSAIIFLSDPLDYDGGELVVEDAYGTHKIKLPAGHAILYPSSSVCHVNPVTKGFRVTSSLWIESMVREDSQRTILFDFNSSVRALRKESGNSEALARLSGVYSNLLRSWSSS